MSVPVLLTVCTGNVCRSPLLERLLQQHLDRSLGPGAVAVRSAGTAARVDSGMDERSARLLRDLGGDPEGFTSRRLTASMVREADLVLTTGGIGHGAYDVVKLLLGERGEGTSRFAHLALRRAADIGAVVPRGFDGMFQAGGHRGLSSICLVRVETVTTGL